MLEKACAHTCWQTRPLWGTHTSAVIKARTLVFFINSRPNTCICSLPTLLHELYILIQSYAREFIVYFTPNSTARSDRPNASDRFFFCVIKRYGFHVEESLMFWIQSDSPAYNESDFFFFGKLCEPSQLSPVYVTLWCRCLNLKNKVILCLMESVEHSVSWWLNCFYSDLLL